MTMDETTYRNSCAHFASLLSYPRPDLAHLAQTCRDLLAAEHPAASAALESFRRFAVLQEQAHLEEIYTATFDLQPHCHPYVGYHLFGEGKQRPFFMVKLQECYQRHGYACRGELPDHLAEVLGFLAMVEDETARQELVEDGLLPALGKMNQGADAATHPYADVLRALEDFLAAETPAGNATCLLQEVES
jgi:nitrate reductase delta subunit